MNIFNINFKEVFNNNPNIDHKYNFSENKIKLSLNLEKFDVYTIFNLDLQQDLNSNTIIEINNSITSIYDYSTQLICNHIDSGINTFLYDIEYKKVFILKEAKARDVEKTDFNILVDRQEVINYANNMINDEINNRKIRYHDLNLTPKIEVLNGGKVIYDGIKDVTTNNDKLYHLTTEFVIVTDVNYNEIKRIRIEDVLHNKITHDLLNAAEYRYYNFDKIYVDENETIYIYSSQYQQFKEGNEPSNILIDDDGWEEIIDQQKPIVFNISNTKRKSMRDDDYVKNKGQDLKTFIDSLEVSIFDPEVLSKLNSKDYGISIRLIDSVTGNTYWGNTSLKNPIVSNSNTLTNKFTLGVYTDKILTAIDSELDNTKLKPFLDNDRYNVGMIDIEISISSINNSVNYIPLMDTLRFNYKNDKSIITERALTKILESEGGDTKDLNTTLDATTTQRLFKSQNEIQDISDGEDLKLIDSTLKVKLFSIHTLSADMIHLSYVRNSVTDFKGSIFNIYLKSVSDTEYKIHIPNDPLNDISNSDSWDGKVIDIHNLPTFINLNMDADYVNVSLYSKGNNKFYHTFTIYNANTSNIDNVKLYSDLLMKPLDKDKAQRLLIASIDKDGNTQIVNSKSVDHGDNKLGIAYDQNKLSYGVDKLYKDCDEYITGKDILLSGSIGKSLSKTMRSHALYHPLFVKNVSYLSNNYIMVVYAVSGYYSGGLSDSFIVHLYEDGDFSSTPIIFDNNLNIMGKNMMLGNNIDNVETKEFIKYGRIDTFSSILDINNYEEMEGELYLPTRLGEVLCINLDTFKMDWIRTQRKLIPDVGRNKNLHVGNSDIIKLSNQSLGNDNNIECVIDIHSQSEINVLAPHNVYNHSSTYPVGYIIKMIDDVPFMYMTYNDDLYMGSESIVFNLKTKKEITGYSFEDCSYRYTDTTSLCTEFDNRYINLSLNDYKSNQLKIINRNRPEDLIKYRENHKISIPLGINDKFEKGSTLIKDVYSSPLKFLQFNGELLLIVRNSSNVFTLNIDSAIDEYANNTFTKQLFNSEITDKVITHLEHGSEITLSENGNKVYDEESHALINEIMSSRFNSKSLYLNGNYIDIVTDNSFISDVVIGFDDIIGDRLSFNFYIFINHLNNLEVRIYQLILSKKLVNGLYHLTNGSLQLKANKIIQYNMIFNNINLYKELVSLYSRTLNHTGDYSNKAVSRFVLPQLDSSIFYDMFNNYDNVIISSTDVLTHRRRYDSDTLLDGSFNININGIISIPLSINVHSLFNTNNNELFSIDVKLGNGIIDTDVRSTPETIDDSNHLLSSNMIINNIINDVDYASMFGSLIYYPIAFNTINDINVYYMMNKDHFLVVMITDKIKGYSIDFSSVKDHDLLYLYNEFQKKIFDILISKDGDKFKLNEVIDNLPMSINSMDETKFKPKSMTKSVYNNKTYNTSNGTNNYGNKAILANVFITKDFNPVKYDSTKQLLGYPLLNSPIRYDNNNLDEFDKLYKDTTKSTIKNIKYDLLPTYSTSKVFNRRFVDYKSSNNTHVFASTWHINRLNKTQYAPLGDKGAVDTWNNLEADYQVAEDIQYGMSAYGLDVDKYKESFLQSHTSLAYLMSAPIRHFGSYYYSNNMENYEDVDENNKKTSLIPTNNNYSINTWNKTSRFTSDIAGRYDALLMKALRNKIHATSYIPYNNTMYDSNVTSRIKKLVPSEEIHFSTDLRNSIPAIHSSPIIYGTNPINNMLVRSSSYYKSHYNSYYLNNRVIEDKFNKETWFMYGDMSNSTIYTKNQNTIVMYPDSHSLFFQPLSGMPRVGKNELSKSFDSFETLGVSNTFLNEYAYSFYKNSTQFEVIKPLNDIKLISSSFSNTIDKNTKKSYDYHQYTDSDGRIKKYEYFNNRMYVVDINDIAKDDLISPYDLLEGTDEYFNPFFNNTVTAYSNKVKSFSNHRYIHNDKIKKYLDQLRKWYNETDIVGDEYVNTITVAEDDVFDLDTIELNDNEFKIGDKSFDEDNQSTYTNEYKYSIPITYDSMIILNKNGNLHLAEYNQQLDDSNKIQLHPSLGAIDVSKIYDITNLENRGNIVVSALLGMDSNGGLTVLILEYDFNTVKIIETREITNGYAVDINVEVIQLQNGIYYISDLNNSYILNINNFNINMKKIDKLNKYIGNGRFLISDNTKGLNTFNGLNTSIYDITTNEVIKSNTILNGYDKTTLYNSDNKIKSQDNIDITDVVNLESLDGKSISNTIHPNENIITWITMDNNVRLSTQTMNVIINSNKVLKDYFASDDTELLGINKLTLITDDNDNLKEDISFDNKLYGSTSLSIFNYNVGGNTSKYAFDISRNIDQADKVESLFPDTTKQNPDILEYIDKNSNNKKTYVTRTETLMPNGMICINVIPLGIYTNPYIIEIIYDPVNKVIESWEPLCVPVIELELIKEWINSSTNYMQNSTNEILFNKDKQDLTCVAAGDKVNTFKHTRKSLNDYFDDEILPNIKNLIHGVDLSLSTGDYGSGYITKGDMVLQGMEYDIIILSKLCDVQYSTTLKDTGINTLMLIKHDNDAPKLAYLITSPTNVSGLNQYLSLNSEFMKADLLKVDKGDLNFALKEFNNQVIKTWMLTHMSEFSEITDLEEVNIINTFKTTECDGFTYFKYIYTNLDKYISNHNGDTFGINSKSTISLPTVERFSNNSFNYFIYCKAYNRQFADNNVMHDEYDLLTLILREDRDSNELTFCFNPINNIGSATAWIDEYNSIYVNTNGVIVDNSKIAKDELKKVQKSHINGIKNMLIKGVKKEEYILTETNLDVELDDINISDLIDFDWRTRLSEPFNSICKNNYVPYNNKIEDLYNNKTAVGIIDKLFSTSLNTLCGGKMESIFNKTVYGFKMHKSLPERNEVSNLLIGNKNTYNVELKTYVDAVESSLNKYINAVPLEINGLSNEFKYSEELIKKLFPRITALDTTEIMKQQGLRNRLDDTSNAEYDYSIITSYALDLSINMQSNMNNMEVSLVNDYMGIVGIVFRKNKTSKIIDYFTIRENNDVNHNEHKLYTSNNMSVQTANISLSKEEYRERLNNFSILLKDSLMTNTSIVSKIYNYTVNNTDYKYVKVGDVKVVGEMLDPLANVNYNTTVASFKANPNMFDCMRLDELDFMDGSEVKMNVDATSVSLPSVNIVNTKYTGNELSIDDIKDRIDLIYDNYSTDLQDDLVIKHYEGLTDNNGVDYYSITLINQLTGIWKDNTSVHYVFDLMFRKENDKVLFATNETEYPDDYSFTDKTKPISWICAQDKSSTAAPASTIQLKDSDYYIYNSQVDADNIVLDKDLKPYKVMYNNGDPENILGTQKANMISTFILIPLYTDTDGKYYFMLDGVKYKGADHGAEVFRAVTYLKGYYGLDPEKNTYIDPTAITADHKPILPVTGDTNIKYLVSQDYKDRKPHEDLVKENKTAMWREFVNIDWGYSDVDLINNELQSELQLRSLIFNPKIIELDKIYDATSVSYIDLPRFIETVKSKLVGQDNFYNLGFDSDIDIFTKWDDIKTKLDDYINPILPQKVAAEVVKYEKDDYKYIIYVNTFEVYDIDGVATTDDKKIMQCIYITSQNKITLDIQTRLEVLDKYYMNKLGNIKPFD